MLQNISLDYLKPKRNKWHTKESANVTNNFKNNSKNCVLSEADAEYFCVLYIWEKESVVYHAKR
jgi:hypothetical protein